jgi:hypothetical protein
MIKNRPSVLLVAERDSHHVSRAAEIASAGFKVVVASPAELVGRILVALSFDVIVVDRGLDEEVVALLKRIALVSPDTLRVLVGGDPANTEMLRESGIVHHHLASLDLEALVPLFRGGPNEDDTAQADGLEADDEAR